MKGASLALPLLFCKTGNKMGGLASYLTMDAQTMPKPWQCTEMELRKLPLEISLPRRMECVNALQGVKRPVAAIQSARDGLRSLIEKAENTGWQKSEMEKGRRALAMLEGLD